MGEDRSMRISDIIAAYINDMLEEATDGEARLRRNELAEELGCVPSQINYVLTSRFTPEQGYIVESRRGGGGYILVRRIRTGRDAGTLMHVINAVGDTLSHMTAGAILDNLVYHGALSRETARVMAAAVSDQSYKTLSPQYRDELRAVQLKTMLGSLLIGM